MSEISLASHLTPTSRPIRRIHHIGLFNLAFRQGPPHGEAFFVHLGAGADLGVKFETDSLHYIRASKSASIEYDQYLQGIGQYASNY